MSGAPLGALPPAGWACSEGGEIKNGEPQCKEGEDYATFKHSQSLEAEDVLRMKVVAGGSARVGIAAEGFDVERDSETCKRTAVVGLEYDATCTRTLYGPFDWPFGRAPRTKGDLQHLGAL